MFIKRRVVEQDNENLTPAQKRKRLFLRRGSQLTDTLLAIGIGGGMLAGLGVIIAKNYAAKKASDLTQEILVIMDTVHNTDGQNQPDYQQVSAESIAKSGLVPPKYVSGSNLISSYGGSISVVGTSAGGGTHGLTTFTITIDNVSKAGCVKAATTDFGDALVSRTPSGGQDGADDGEAAPLTLNTAQGACATGSQLTFEFT